MVLKIQVKINPLMTWRSSPTIRIPIICKYIQIYIDSKEKSSILLKRLIFQVYVSEIYRHLLKNNYCKNIEINPVEVLIFHCYALVDDKDGIELENINVSEDENRLHPSNEIGVEGASETKAKKCSFFSSQFRRLKDTLMDFL